MTHRVPVAVFLVALVVRLSAIGRLSPMPSGDGYDRLAHTDRLVVHDWLPLYQGLLDAVALVSRAPGWLRGVNAGVGALAAAAFAILVGTELGASAGLVAGLILAFSPVHALTSAGLYQEPLFVLLVCGALTTLTTRPRVSVLLLAAASLTRYEGWILSGIVAIVLLFRLRRVWPALALAVVPAAWLAWRSIGGLGTWMEPSVAPARWLEQARILRGLLPYWFGWPGVVLAAAGAALLLRDLWRRTPPGRATLCLLAFGVADALFVTILRPFSPPDNARQLHVPLLVLGVLAARLVAGGRLRSPVAGVLVAATVCAPSFPAFLGQGPDPLVERAAALASRLPDLGPGGRVFVLDPGAERWPGGDPTACLVVMAYAGLPRSRVLCDTELPAEEADLATWMRASDVRAMVWPMPGSVELPSHQRVRAAWDAGALEVSASVAWGLGEGSRARRADDPVVLVAGAQRGRPP